MKREVLSKRKPRRISFRHKGGAEKAGERREGKTRRQSQWKKVMKGPCCERRSWEEKNKALSRKQKERGTEKKGWPEARTERCSD